MAKRTRALQPPPLFDIAPGVCWQPGCNRTPLAHGLCPTHYSRLRRTQKRTTPQRIALDPQNCEVCATTYIPDRPGRRACSAKCGGKLSAQHPNYLKFTDQHRSDLRIAIETDDPNAIIAAVRDRVTTTVTGCWEWTGALDESGYGTYEIRTGRKRRRFSPHRLVAHATYGSSPDEPVVHHKCANKRCCAPDHVIPVTQLENNAEMMARNFYLDRKSVV